MSLQAEGSQGSSTDMLSSKPPVRESSRGDLKVQARWLDRQKPVLLLRSGSSKMETLLPNHTLELPEFPLKRGLSFFSISVLDAVRDL